MSASNAANKQPTLKNMSVKASFLLHTRQTDTTHRNAEEIDPLFIRGESYISTIAIKSSKRIMKLGIVEKNDLSLSVILIFLQNV